MNITEIETDGIIYQPQNDTFLAILTVTTSIVGIAFSAGALGLLFLTAVLFAEWRQNYKNQLLIQFMVARFIYTFVSYFCNIRIVIDWDVNQVTTLYFDVFCLIYTETAVVLWMYVFSKQMYDSLAVVFVGENKKLWKVSAFAWVLPGVVAMLLILAVNMHVNTFYIISFYTFFIKWPVLIANAVLLTLALKSVLKNNKSSPENNARIVLVMITLIFMFCFQQVLLDCYKTVYVLVLHVYSVSSAILLSGNIICLYYCAFSIIFWVFGNANTRKMWRGIFKRLTNRAHFESRCLPSNSQ